MRVRVTLRETSPPRSKVYMLLDPPPGAHPAAKNPNATPPVNPINFTKPKAV